MQAKVIDRRRFLAPLAAVAAFPAFASAAARRTPDLQGLWTNASYTRLERPPELKTLVLTPQQARAYEQTLAPTDGVPVPANDTLGQHQSEFSEAGSGLARIRGEPRSSWIIDPADGRLPYNPAAIANLGVGEKPTAERFDNPEDRPTDERCLTASGAGAPIINGFDTNLLQIVQTPDHVVILTEKYHDARIIRLSDTAPPQPAAWMGDSIGHWSGDSLVVETGGLRPGITKRSQRFYLSAQSKVIERFTRIGPAEILYEFTVIDPALFTQTWRGEMVFTTTRGPLYEYACHEGNYSLPSILSAARQGMQEPGGPGQTRR